jgi:predicted Rossmann fold flavoprotein
MDHQTIIIGAGASGLMLASLLPKRSALLIDTNVRCGEKIRISGGGKCNLTNAVMQSSCYVGDASFITPVLGAFNEKALLAWFQKRGLKPVLRKQHQYFCPNSAQELLDILEKESRRQERIMGEKVLSVTKRKSRFYVKTDRRTFTASQVVVASGGLSFPKLGASPIGYEIAESFGHTVTQRAPALVGLTVQKDQFFFKELSGVSTDVKISVDNHMCEGALLFAHKGISGPAVLDASLYWERGRIEIDFLPGFDWKHLQKSHKQISTLLPMPKRVTKAFLLQFGIEDKAGARLSEEELKRLWTLHQYRLAPAGTFGYSKAEVTKGGVHTDEIQPESMQSCKVKGLYFIGEVLDVTGRLGGYNFQWAFSSAFVCASGINPKYAIEITKPA